MFALVFWTLGILAFIAASWICGAWLRRHPSQVNAEKSSRVVHFFFFAGLGVPGLVALITPGLTHLDETIGISPLPVATLFLVIGIILALPGLYYMGSSLRSLRNLGSGANAFRLTKRIVDADVYRYTRNPMSLGYYMCFVSLGFIVGSTLLTLGAIFVIIPAHIFCLKYFEEYELELRFGESYRQYKQKAPFLFPNYSID